MMHGYPNVYSLGHKAIEGIFNDEVLIEEKIDGSQFSAGNINGELVCKSSGKIQFVDAPDDMFQLAIESVKTLDLHPNWIYRCEYLLKPKHNTLAYNRVPIKNLILLDIDTGLESYMSYENKKIEAERLGLEIVPKIYRGIVKDFAMLQEFLQKESILGGQKIEGVVVKNYSRFGKDKKVLMGKYVSEAYKEVHDENWKTANPSKSDFIILLIETYKTEARWQKAIQHLRDNGLLENSPRDIGMLIKEVANDIAKECEDEIKQKLYLHFISLIKRGVTRGLPEWYKEQLAKSSFMETNE